MNTNLNINNKYVNTFVGFKQIWFYTTVIILLFFAGFTSYSRVYNNYHTIEQVVVGGLIGGMFGVISYIIARTILI